ncbi:XkdW family protein [Paenibacillus sp. 481]|uniref:XkdW family protein n=1 Tax=Paenibacillus sp. 481 TaxID=2835869 RepID=UPI001E3654A6|nr:hypothetical protein [Paenibacillus sp. 481]UHA72306.1 hypothetical protein KIK04_16675 [Paenibacillus sp. 481]
MKEAILTDLNGKYIEPTLVADSVTGVFPIRQAVQHAAKSVAATQDQGVAAGAAAVPTEAAVGETLAGQLSEAILAGQQPEGPSRTAPQAGSVAQAVAQTGAVAPPAPAQEIIGYIVAVTVPEGLYQPRWDFKSEAWTEGLSQAEIDKLREPQPKQPSQVELLEQALKDVKQQAAQQQSVLDSVGKELAQAKLELITMKGGKSA